MGSDATARSAEVHEYTCLYCGVFASGAVAEVRKRSILDNAIFHDAGVVCSGCGAFTCQAVACKRAHEKACKAAGVSRKGCPSCRGVGVVNEVLTSPSPPAADFVSGTCGVCGREVEGSVVSKAKRSSIPLAARRGWSCYRCGALICVKHIVTTPACLSCKTLRPYTGMVAVVEGVGLEKVLQQIESDMRGGDKGPHDLLYYRKRYQAAFRASRAEIVAYCFGEGHSILPIAKLVEIGRSDLVDDDLLDRLASAPYVLGLIAVSGNEAAVRRLLAVADDPDPHTRACALSFLSAGKDATGGVREAFTRALCDPAEVNVRGLRPEDPGVSARVRAAEIADFLKPVILQKGLVTPDISIQLIAQAALQNWGIKPDLATLLNVLDASAEPDSRYVRERAVIQIQKQLKGAEPRAIREAVKRLSRAMGDTIHQQSGGETTVEAVAGSASIQRVLKKWIDHLEVADLAPLAKSRSAEIRRHAVELLNALGGPGAVGLLRQLSGDEAKAVAKEAAKTLAKLEK